MVIITRMVTSDIVSVSVPSMNLLLRLMLKIISTKNIFYFFSNVCHHARLNVAVFDVFDMTICK